MQTNVTQDPPIAARGALGDEGPRRVDSASALTTIRFGGGCGRLPTDANRTARGVVTDTNGLVFTGVAFYDTSRQRTDLGSDLDDYPITDTVPVISEGHVWVWAEGAVNPGDPVFARFIAGADPVANAAGNFTTAGDAANTVEIDSGARWVSTTSGAGLALLALNLP